MVARQNSTRAAQWAIGAVGLGPKSRRRLLRTTTSVLPSWPTTPTVSGIFCKSARATSDGDDAERDGEVLPDDGAGAAATVRRRRGNFPAGRASARRRPARARRRCRARPWPRRRARRRGSGRRSRRRRSWRRGAPSLAEAFDDRELLLGLEFARALRRGRVRFSENRRRSGGRR